MVAVSDQDVEKIARHFLGIATADRARHAYTDRRSGASRRPEILRSSQGGSQDGCVFLKGNICSVYTVRPKTCRDFPHIAVDGHTLGGRPSSHARWAALCPIVYNALERYKHLTGFQAGSHSHTSV